MAKIDTEHAITSYVAADAEALLTVPRRIGRVRPRCSMKVLSSRYSMRRQRSCGLRCVT
jgi:hypothetical protein